MATEVKKPRITYVQFRDPVPIGVGEHASIEWWSIVKHGKLITCTEKGNWLVLEAGGSKPVRARVPMTNVAVIKEDDGGEA